MNNNKKIQKILYVEDEKAIQDELSDVIQDYCETLYLAGDGMQGLLQFKEHRPQIVVTDVKMPIQDGIEMAKAIKEIDPNTKIVFTTAFSDYDFLQSAIELQVDGYVLKPVDLDKIDSKLIQLVEDIKNKEDLSRKEQMLIEQSKLASMGEMIGNIAHQWRQPLATISSKTVNLHLKIELGQDIAIKELNQCLDVTQEQVQYLTDTISDFQNFFKPSSMDKAEKISDTIEKCVKLVKATFDSGAIDVVSDIDKNIELKGDHNQLLQALINILNNSRDALNAAEDIQKKLVFMFTANHGENNDVVITIKDNAGGIPDNVLDRIFEPYFTTKHQSKGTGLGLYIVHSIICKNFRGSIEVKNEQFEYEGETYRGAEFTIKIPLN